MQSTAHTMDQLFDRLGLPSGEHEIDNFIERQKPVSSGKEIYELEFFNESQKAFLKRAKMEGTDWAELTDTLDALLRKQAVIRPA